MATFCKTVTVRKAIETYETEDGVIQAALAILAQRMGKRGAALCSPTAVRDYLRITLCPLEYETFWAVFCDSQNRVIACRELFRGTITQASVFPREVVKEALAVNAAGVIFAHNHPSGVAEPSYADENLTRTLKQTLALVDCRVLDHFVIGHGGVFVSFAERGLL